MSFSRRLAAVSCLTFSLCLSLLLYMTGTMRDLRAILRCAPQPNPAKSIASSVPIDPLLQAKLDLLIKQRNDLSRKANTLARELSQLQCTTMSASAKTKASKSGGWCAEVIKTHHVTDEGLVGALRSFLAGKRVVSFGDGPGQYKLKIQSNVTSFDAFDGAPYSETATNGVVKHLDLSIPQFGLPVYDWVMSLEVAEHIPAEFEAIFLGNLSRHSREGIILSWAAPGQEGYSHINNRPQEYVEARMKDLCYELSLDESKMLKKAATFWWFKNNVNVYRRRTGSAATKECEIDTLLA